MLFQLLGGSRKILLLLIFGKNVNVIAPGNHVIGELFDDHGGFLFADFLGNSRNKMLRILLEFIESFGGNTRQNFSHGFSRKIGLFRNLPQKIVRNS